MSFIIPLALIAGIIGFGWWYAMRQNGGLSGAPVATQVFLPAAATKTSGCKISGKYPDTACTPGKIISGITKDRVCTAGYTQSVSGISNAAAAEIYSSYGIARHAAGQYVIDRLVPLSLGGSNDPANLWPESASPKPGYHEKDLAEAYLVRQVCAGSVSLADAQREIDKDWYSVYSQSLIN